MKKQANYVYFVEGECEEKMVNVLKHHFHFIQNGRVKHISPAHKKITEALCRTLSNKTNAVLVFDTDVNDCSILKILEDNIKFLKDSPNISNVICIPQVLNFEDEIMRSTDIKKLSGLFSAKSKADFKRNFIKTKEEVVFKDLKQHHFDFEKFWKSNPKGIYSHIPNNSDDIRL